MSILWFKVVFGGGGWGVFGFVVGIGFLLQSNYNWQNYVNTSILSLNKIRNQ